MLNQTANQLAVFTQGLLVGGVFCLVTTIIERALCRIIKDKLFLIIQYIAFAAVGGIINLAIYLNMYFIEYRLYIPLSFVLGYVIMKYPINEIIANLQNMLYNKKKKAGK